jgi:NAD-dependent dihydropyrimidine dehydrogenase PreA subunit
MVATGARRVGKHGPDVPPAGFFATDSGPGQTTAQLSSPVLSHPRIEGRDARDRSATPLPPLATEQPLARLQAMTHVITQPCITVKDKSCVDVCPVDCIHGKDTDPQLYINPNDCIDCTLCVDACPVSAIFAAEDVPAEWASFTQTNAAYFSNPN